MKINVNGKEALNMVAYDFLGIAGDPKIMVRFVADQSYSPYGLKKVAFQVRTSITEIRSMPIKAVDSLLSISAATVQEQAGNISIHVLVRLLQRCLLN